MGNASKLPESPEQGSIANFKWFSYQGQDAAFERATPAGHYTNPVLAGFYPDPSIVRVGDDFYLVNSSFAYFPGLPIFHSRNLVNWRQIGHGLSRRSQLTFATGLGMSRGLFAPTLRHYDGVFYIINTDVDGIGNFLITASDPAGPWSDPIPLPEVGGIDPDLFFDDDGRVYIVHNDEPKGPSKYDGHRTIWLWEFDLANRKVIPSSARVVVNGGVDLSSKPSWIEGPHLYKKNGWYYLLCAEGGTGSGHSEVIFRSPDLQSEFVPYEHNPILTQRDLKPGRPYPITSTGHADLVSTPNGDWWAVFLGVRPYSRDNFNTGRETFLLPVEWKDDWPIILDQGREVPQHVAKPKLPQPEEEAAPQAGNFTWRDDFDGEALRLNWVKLRSSNAQWLKPMPEVGELQLTPLKLTLSDKAQPAYLGRRQQHGSFTAHTEMQLPTSTGFSAGIALFQNSSAHYYLGAMKVDGGYRLFVEQVTPKGSRRVAERTVDLSGNVVLGITQSVDRLGFSFQATEVSEPVVLAHDQDATVLGSTVAGGFIGVTLGMHARLE